MSLGHDGLGFAGMLALGIDPQTAWQDIHDGCHTPSVMAILANMTADPEGQAALEYARKRWAEYGLPAPFDPIEGQAEVTP